MRKLRLGTRGSTLALAQATKVANAIMSVEPDIEISIVVIKTTGDALYDANLALLGGKGLFLKEIEEAILAGTIDFGVHSMKDVPFCVSDGLTISCVMDREDPRDALILNRRRTLMTIPKGSFIGTCSARRALYIKHYRPDLNILPIRGNIDTRIAKVRNEENGMYGIMLAYSGLKRLGLDHNATEVLPAEPDKDGIAIIPAVGQGALALEYRRADEFTVCLAEKIKNIQDSLCVDIERSFMARMNGDCTVPIAAHAKLISGDRVSVSAMYKGPATNNHLQFAHYEGEISTPKEIGNEVAELICTGAGC